MLQIFPYQCECGWHSEYITGGFRRVIPLEVIVENQLVRATNSNAKAIWRDVYKKVIRGEVLPDDIKVREGYVSCFHCKNSHNNQIALYDSSNQLIHPILCYQCGREGHFCSPAGPTVCPWCTSMVTTGDVFSTQEQIHRLIQSCQVTIPALPSDSLIIVIGERSNKYLRPFLNNIPFISIQEGERGDGDMDVINILSTRKRVFLHTYFETPLVTRLTLLFVKQLLTMNIEVIPIIATPPPFDGKRRIVRVRGYIQEIQSYCNQTVLVSSSIRKKFDSVMELFEHHIPSQIIEVINRYSLEKEVTSEYQQVRLCDSSL
jgi:uncharacterized CHY-type Zn-finger protein